MKVSREEILKIADLADLKLTDNEVNRYMTDLEDILNFAEVVNSANTKELEETKTMTENSNVFRKDEICQKYTREELMKNAPEQASGMFKIPKVIN